MTRHLALVGPTASGKSALALEVARIAGDVELVSLDSMQVYRGLDIGTAKPAPAELSEFVHHLVNVADPAEEWSVQRTQVAARAAIADIEARGKRAVLVGGTGLYVRAVVDDLQIPPTDQALRDTLDDSVQDDAGLASAYSRLTDLDPIAAARMEPGNRRRIVRALEVIELTGRRFSSFGPGISDYASPAISVTMYGVDFGRDDLRARIAARFDAMRAQGLLDEVRRLADQPLSRTAREAIGYRELLAHLAGDLPDLDEAFDAAVRRTRRFARRQRVWFARDPRVQWIAGGGPSRELAADLVRGAARAGAIGYGRSMSDLRLAKLHATGNDFLVQVELDPIEPELDAVVVSALCDRHRGVGADGLITIGPGHDGADCSMTLVNADGGRAEMSGNGVRCLAWVAARAGLVRGDELVVDTAAGRRQVTVERDSWGDVIAADVDMGSITFDPDQIPVASDSPFGLEVRVDGTTYRGDAAGIGNPHFVVVVDDPAAVPVTEHGPRIEHDPLFPRRVNVEFIAVTGDDRLAMRVWERGAGETQSCGTGACASAAVAHRSGLVGRQVRVDVVGGSLAVALGDTVRLGGPVVHVFDVVMPRESLLESLARPTG